MSRCQINLTFCSLSGYLFPLSPLSSMRSSETLSSSVEAQESSTASRSVMQRLRSLAGSSKAKITAAVLAAAGAIENANKAEAGLVIPAEVTSNSTGIDYNPDDAALLIINDFGVGIGNGEDNNLGDIKFYAFSQPNPDFVFDTSFPNGGQVESEIVTPDNVHGNGVVSDDLIALVDLPAFQNTEIAIGGNSTQHPLPALRDVLSETRVLIGFDGEFTSDPRNASTVQQLMDMFDGRILDGQLPRNPNDANGYIISSPSNVPEPSSAAYLAAAGAGALATGRRRRK